MSLKNVTLASALEATRAPGTPSVFQGHARPLPVLDQDPADLGVGADLRAVLRAAAAMLLVIVPMPPRT